jgi:hypothetical protein
MPSSKRPRSSSKSQKGTRAHSVRPSSAWRRTGVRFVGGGTVAAPKRVEVKSQYWTSPSGTSTPSDVALLYPTDIAQGTAVDARVGDHIYAKRLTVMGRIIAENGGVNDAVRGCRVIIIRDSSPNTTAVTPADFLLTSTAGAQWNPSKLGRFHCLYDSGLHSLCPYQLITNAVGQSPCVKDFNIDLTLNFPVHYQASPANFSSTLKNMIGIYIIPDAVTGVTHNAWTCKLDYTDL